MQKIINTVKWNIWFTTTWFTCKQSVAFLFVKLKVEIESTLEKESFEYLRLFR